MNDFLYIKLNYKNYIDEIKEMLADDFKGEFISEFMWENYHKTLNAEEQKFGCKEYDIAEKEWEKYADELISDCFYYDEYKHSIINAKIVDLVEDLILKGA